MKLKLAAVACSLVAAAVVYLVLFSDRAPSAPPDELATLRTQCGDADVLKGDIVGAPKIAACLELATTLMGGTTGARPTPYPVDDATARALLKKLCDQASEAACTQLRDFDDVKLDIASDRCKYAKPADPRGCIDVGHSWTQGRTFHDGRTRPVNHAEARKWYALACDLGDAEGCRLKSP